MPFNVSFGPVERRVQAFIGPKFVELRNYRTHGQLVLLKSWLLILKYTWFSNGYDVTVLALLSHRHDRHMGRCSVIAWWGKQILFDCFDKYNNVLNKPTNMCSIVHYVKNYSYHQHNPP